MVQDNRFHWYNYLTDEYDLLEVPTTDDEALKYIPQGAATQNLYRCHRALCKNIAEAMIATLKACVGEKSN